MLNILVADSQDNSMQNLVSVFKQNHKVRVTTTQTGSQALELLSSQAFELVVTAERLKDISGLALIKKIVTTNPMINCAAESGLGHDDFHEASEGLGILMQLPLRPKTEHATALLKQVQDICNLMDQD